MRLDQLNALDAATAEGEFLRCCGSTRWARLMAEARPLPSVDAALLRADTIWRSLEPDDWLEAFAAHPRIGESKKSRGWSDQEQAGARTGNDAVLDRLAEANRHYEARFGYIFIICATGKGADEMLAALERRLTNQPDEELPIAAEEQGKITRLRIAKLVT
jgi:OHCU decarboxylase